MIRVLVFLCMIAPAFANAPPVGTWSTEIPPSANGDVEFAGFRPCPYPFGSTAANGTCTGPSDTQFYDLSGTTDDGCATLQFLSYVSTQHQQNGTCQLAGQAWDLISECGFDFSGLPLFACAEQAYACIAKEVCDTQGHCSHFTGGCCPHTGSVGTCFPPGMGQ